MSTADHVGHYVVSSPEGAVSVTSTGTKPSYPRPPPIVEPLRKRCSLVKLTVAPFAPLCYASTFHSSLCLIRRAYSSFNDRSYSFFSCMMSYIGERAATTRSFLEKRMERRRKRDTMQRLYKDGLDPFREFDSCEYGHKVLQHMLAVITLQQ